MWQLAGKVEPKEIQPGVGVAMVSGLLVANDNQYTLQVIHVFIVGCSYTTWMKPYTYYSPIISISDC